MMNYNQYSKLQRLEMSEFNLKQFGYPRGHPTTPGKAEVCNVKKKYNHIANPSTRLCERCNKSYQVNQDGRPQNPEECRHHPYRPPNLGKPYRCCSGNRTAKPCKVASQHVTKDLDLKDLTGFMVTKDNTCVDTRAAYGLDCEMIYTDGGMEVAALSLVDSNCDVVYETKVKPDHRIVDYNTEFSGLKSRDFIGVTTTLKDVHAKLLTLIGPNTILVGHGLDHDLLRLHIIHDHVVDTVIAYPHKRGLPFLNSLQYLKDSFLPYGVINPYSALKCRGDALAVMKLALRKV